MDGDGDDLETSRRDKGGDGDQSSRDGYKYLSPCSSLAGDLFVWALRSQCIVTICLNCTSVKIFSYYLL